MHPGIIFLLTAILFISWQCLPKKKQSPEAKTAVNTVSEPVSHQLFTNLLQKHVSADGKVNYRAFLADSSALNHYLDQLSQHPPATNWSRSEKLAYWINAYNGFTLQLVLRYYPIKSIKDIGSKLQIPFINTPWDIPFIRIGGKKLDLNEVEHTILRKQFAEPRIHFAIVCASVSCPGLLNEAYTADKLEQQLNQQARNFINDTRRNIIQADKIQLSKIFSWFKGDFTRQGSLIDFLNQYAQVQINPGARIESLNYDWNLNE